MADYWAGHDIAIHGALTCQVTAPAPGTVVLPQGVYAHVGITAPETIHELRAHLQLALQVIHAGFGVSFDATTLVYTITNSSAFSITFPDAILRDALGFSASVISGTSVSSTRRPTLVIRPSIDAESDVSHPYEPDDGAAEVIADDGTPYGVTRSRTRVRMIDWVQFGESRSATLREYATASVPWTWEDFIVHVRSHTPWIHRSRLYRFRADGALWTPEVRERVVADWDDLWSIRIRAHTWGAVT